MLSRLRKPPAPETPDFWDRLEAELRRRMVSSPQPRHSRTRGILRVLRPVARPALHGVMALIAVLMVGAMGLPSRNTAPIVETQDLAQFTGWVPVVEVQDPQAPVDFYALVESAPRFITFIESQPGEYVPEVQDLSAV